MAKKKHVWRTTPKGIKYGIDFLARASGFNRIGLIRLFDKLNQSTASDGKENKNENTHAYNR